MTRIGKHRRPQEIGLDRLDLVGLTPVDIWAASLARAIDDVSRLDPVKHFEHFCLVLHAYCGGLN